MTAAVSHSVALTRGRVDGLLRDRETIGLAELSETAELLTRVDRKYLLPADELPPVIAALPEGTRVLSFGDDLSSAYSSTYFDTPEWDSYLGAAHRRRRRAKIRTRSYLDSGIAFLEVKTRGSRSLTVKERIEYSSLNADRITDEGAEYVTQTLAAAQINGLGVDRLAPVLRTGYRRTTLLLPVSGSRATIDVQLSWDRVGGRTIRTPHLAIVETKSASSPSELDRILWAHGIRPVAISKFATGIALLEPELPSNKWSRIVRTRFSAGAGRHPAARR
ncbi:MAG: polyphosphate polymerase domain-containing protein [Mycetocola sp.]